MHGPVHVGQDCQRPCVPWSLIWKRCYCSIFFLNKGNLQQGFLPKFLNPWSFSTSGFWRQPYVQGLVCHVIVMCTWGCQASLCLLSGFVRFFKQKESVFPCFTWPKTPQGSIKASYIWCLTSTNFKENRLLQAYSLCSLTKIGMFWNQW